jgi:RNA polymerase sigma-B factor
MVIEENDSCKKREQTISKNERISNYQYLVSKIAKQFNNISEPHENLEEVGYLGLLNATNLYDRNIHKVDFKTYAQLLITEEIHQYLLNRHREIDCPDWLISLNEQINEFVIRYREKHHSFPKISDIASHFNITDNGLQELLKARDSLREINLPFPQPSSSYDLGAIKPNLNKIKNRHYRSFKLPIEDVIMLRRAIKRINEIKEDIIYYLFVMDLSKTKLAHTLRVVAEKEKE